MKLKTVGIVSKPKKDSVCAVVPGLLDWLKERGIEAVYDTETAGCLGRSDGIPRAELPEKVDLLVVLGGDGTLLAAGRLIRDFSIPILAVNLGQLGFLTEITVDELYEVLEEVAEGRHTAEQRILLEARIQRDGKEVACYDAVNDIVLHKTSLARIVDFEISLDGSFASSIRADGLILSTPTGSTAYSLSAGGPVVLPNVDAIIITPIAPHMLTTRPLVLPSSSKIEAKFKYREEPIYLTADGQVGEELRPGDTITVAKSPRSMKLIRSPKRDFFEILRSKLGWGAR